MRQSGNIQPCVPEIEDALIGAILLEPFVLPKVVAMLKPECFYKSDNRLIFTACIALWQSNQVIDILTTTQKLKALNQLESVGGAYGVSSKTNRVASAANAEIHAALIYEKYVLRELMRISNKTQMLCEEPKADALEILETIFKDFAKVDFIGKSNVQQVGDVAISVIEQIKKIGPNHIKPGIGTGHKGVDCYYSKQKQDLTIIAARPGQGKTAYMLSLAKHTAIKLQKPVAIFSLEMSTVKLVNRLMASESEVSSKNINEQRISQNEMMALGGGISRLIYAPLYIDDTAGLDIMSLRSKVRKMKQQYGIEEVYIDYLQLMGSKEKGNNREQEISHISRNLKMIAKEEDICITALSQLSRKVEERPSKKPQLSDLRESGAIEQDADTVFFIMRPEYYGMGAENGLYEGETFGGRNLNVAGLMLLDCAKYREGALFQSPLLFVGEYMQVLDHPQIYGNTEIVDYKAMQANDNFLNQ